MHIQLRFLIHSEMINTNNKTITLSAISFNFHCPIATLREWVVSSHLISSHLIVRFVCFIFHCVTPTKPCKIAIDQTPPATAVHETPLFYRLSHDQRMLFCLDWIGFDSTGIYNATAPTRRDQTREQCLYRPDCLNSEEIFTADVRLVVRCIVFLYFSCNGIVPFALC